MAGHIHIMIIELLMKLDVILKNVGCTVTKMLDQNISRLYAGKERERNIYPSPSQSVEENEADDKDAGDFYRSNFWHMPLYSPSWQESLSISQLKQS